VRSNVTKKQLDNIRKSVYIKANYNCEICGGKGTEHLVECHEVWIYDDTTLIQRLGHFQALCPLCHEVKHIGLADIMGNGDRAFNRFKSINKLDDTIASKIRNAVFKQWRIRSEQQWKLDIEHLKEYRLNPDELKDRRER
jgi:5-methylcytosine-specific restriction endonuclease McrA